MRAPTDYAHLTRSYCPACMGSGVSFGSESTSGVMDNGFSASVLLDFATRAVLLADEMAKTLAEKREAYGTPLASSGEFMKLLYPVDITPEQYQDALTLIRMFDKMCRIANHPEGDPMNEDPWRDICGYAMLALLNR